MLYVSPGQVTSKLHSCQSLNTNAGNADMSSSIWFYIRRQRRNALPARRRIWSSWSRYAR